MANLFQAWDEDIQALGAAKASDDQIEARRQQLAEHFKAKAKAAGLSSKKIYETLDQFDAYSRQNTTAQDDQLTPEEQEMAQRVKDGTVGAGAIKEVGKAVKDAGIGALSSLAGWGGAIAQTAADVGENDKSELASQAAQGLYNVRDELQSNYSEGTKLAKKDFWTPRGLAMGLAENAGQIAGSATVFGAAGKLAAARGLGKAATLLTAGTVGAPLAYSQGYGQGKENSLDEINKTSNAQLWENVKAEAKAYDDAGGEGEVPYLVGMFKEAGGDLNLMKDLMAENAGNRAGIMTVGTEPLAMGVGSLMSRGAAAGGKGFRAGLVNSMNNQGMSNELARRIAAGASAAEARKAGQIVGTTALRDNAAIASQAAKIAAVQGMRGTGQEGIQEGGEGYIAKTEGSLAAGRKGELTGKDWRGENGIIQQGLQGAAIGGIMAGGSVYSTASNASKLALEKNGLPEKHDAALVAKEQADAALVQAANIADADPENIDAQKAYADALDTALVATNDLEQLTGKFNALYTPEEQAVIKAATMEGVAARKKVADDAAKAQKELDDANAKEQADIAAQQAEAIKTQRDAVVNNLAGMVGDDVALSNAVADLGLSEEEANSLLDDAHKVAKKQKKEAAKQPAPTPATATPKTPFEIAVDEAFNADGTRNPKAMSSDIAKKHNIPLKPLVDAISERIAKNSEKAKQDSNKAAYEKEQASRKSAIEKEAALNNKQKVADAKKSDLADKQQLENTLADFAANNDHDSMVNFLRDYEPTEADKLIKNAYASVENKKKAEQDAIAATKKAEALKVKESEAKTQAEQKKIAFNQDMADLHATNPNATMADLNVIGKKHGVKSPIELAKAWVKVKNEAKAAKEAAPKLALPSPETATKDERDVSVPTGLNINRDNIENQDRRPIIVRNDGKPFPTQAQAEKALEVKSKKPRKKKEQPITKDTHEVIPIDGGFAIAPVVEIQQPKKPDDNEDGGVIADAPKPNAPVSPTGEQVVDNAPTQSIEGEYQHSKIESAKATVTKTDKGYDVDWGDDVQSFTGKNAAEKTQAALKKENFNKKNPDNDNGGVPVEPVAPKPVSPMGGNSAPQTAPKTDAEQIRTIGSKEDGLIASKFREDLKSFLTKIDEIDVYENEPSDLHKFSTFLTNEILQKRAENQDDLKGFISKSLGLALDGSNYIGLEGAFNDRSRINAVEEFLYKKAKSTESLSFENKEKEYSKTEKEHSKSNGQQISEAMDKTATAITEAAHNKVVERIRKGEEIVYKKPDAIERAKQDDRYQVEINDKGHAVVKNIKDSNGEWVRKKEKAEENNSDVERIAALYAAKLGHPVSKRSREFASDILSKNAYGLEFIANGMNDKGKEVFSEVTGVSLPKQQGATWKAIRDWAGVSDEQENHRVAMRDVAYATKAFMRDNNVGQDVADKNKELIASKIAEGFNSIEKIGNNYWFTDGKGQGINLSEKPKKGYLGLSKSRALIEAMIAEVKAAKAKESNTKDKAIVPEEAKQEVKEAVHIENGKAEEVTPEIIRESLAKVDDKPIRGLTMSLKQGKQWLLDEANTALAAVKNEAKAAEAKRVIAVAKAKEELAIAEKALEDNKVNDDSAKLREAMQKKQVELIKAKTMYEPERDYVTFNVPNDGSFKVLKTVEALESFIKKVNVNRGFDKQSPKKVFPSVAQNSADTTIAEFLSDGEVENAYEFAKLQDKPIRFGAGQSNGKPIALAYALAEPVDLGDGFKGFVGLSLDKKTDKKEWMFIEENSRLSIGFGSLTKQGIIKEAKERLAQLSSEQKANLLKNSPKSEKTDAEFEQQWLSQIGYNPNQNDDEVKADVKAKAEDKQNKAIGDEILNQEPEKATTKVVDEKPTDGIIKEEYPTATVLNGWQNSSRNANELVRSFKRAYEDYINEAYNGALSQAETDAQKKVLEKESLKLQKEYIKRVITLAKVRSGVTSSFIAGGSNFNNKQAQNRGNAFDKASRDFENWLLGNKYTLSTAVQEARSPEQLAAIKAEKDAKAQKLQDKNDAFLRKVLSFKKGDDFTIGKNKVVRVNVNKYGMPISLTLEGVGITKGLDDKINLFGKNMSYETVDDLKQNIERVKEADAIDNAIAEEEKPAPVTQPESKPTPIASTSSSDLTDEEYIALKKAYNDFKAKTDKINATYSRDVALEIATGLVAEMPDKEDKIRQALIDAIRENQWNRFEINFPKQPIKVETDVELNRALKRLQKALEGTDYTVNGTFNGKSAKLLFSYKSGANGSRESVIIDRINGKFTSYHVDFDNMSREFLKPLMDATVKWLNGEEIPKMKLGDDSQWDYTTLLSTPRHIDNAFNEAKANAPTVSKSDKLAQSYDEAKTKTMEQRQSESRAEKMADHKKRIDALPIGVRRALSYGIYQDIAESKGDYVDGAYPANLEPNDIGDMTSYYKEKANKEPRNKGATVGYSDSKDYALDRKALRELADNGLYSDSYLGDNKVEPEAKQQPTKEEAPKQEANSKTPTLDKHNALMDSVRNGKATAEDFKQSFADIYANKDAILLELNALTKDQLLKEGGYAVQYRHKNDKKSEVADAVYHSMIAEYALGRGITYGMGKNSYENAVQKMVESTDQQRLDDFAQEYKQMIDGRISDMKAKAEALENPQTLDDFRMLMRSIMADGKSRQEAFLTLSAEHRIKYDELEAESTKEARETRKRAAQANINTASQTTDGKIIETKHTRDGYDLFVVQLSDRLSTDDYKKVLSEAKKLGGWYSSYKGGGAIVGFQFKDKEAAQAFLALAGGDTTAAKEQLSQKQDDYADNRSQSAAERLLDMAEKIEAKANEELDRDRKANTARRARFAMSAENEARAKIALAKTMRNIAEAIKNGKAKFLDNIRMKVDVEALRAYITTAKDNEIRSEYDSYAEQVKRKGQPATAATADFATYPTYTLFRSDLAFLGRQLLEIDGLKKLGQQIMAVADDVSDAYLDFARKNLYKVSRFQTKDSALATFSSKETAERAIKKSGLTGKAIVLQVKRGENIVILSPSEAINLKVWEGDADKRITLKREFGNQLVEAVGRRAGKNNRLLPYQFQYAYDKLKALSRIGIETPSEFRSALREFIALQEEATNNKVREMEMAMVGRKKDGLDFFPTPQAIAQQMIDSAEITEDMAVLEPSAGMGHIADMIRAAGAEPDVIEMSGDRRELLQEKGYHLAEVNDFMDMQPRTFFTFGDVFVAPDGKEGVMRGSNGQRVRLDDNEGKTIGYYNRDELTGVSHKGTDSGYDRIIMNPPFSNRQDAEHVRHAYELLRPNGRIIAIMGEGVFFGSDKKAVEFREWLESVGGTSEKLPDNSFMDSSLPVNTGVNARMVIIDKQDSDSQVNEDKPKFSRGEGEGLTTTQTRAILVKRFGEKLIKTLEDKGLLTIMATPPSWAEPDADGAYDKDSGKAYLFTDNLSAETVVATLAHELAGHKGFQEMMSPTAYQSLMRQFNRLVKQGNAIALAAKARAEAAEVVTPTADTKEAIALAEKQTLQRQQDELLPYLLTLQATLNATRSQQSAVTKVIEQVYRAVKAWLYRTLSAKGYDGLASKLLQPKDITLLAERMIREMRNGTNPSNKTNPDIRFSQLNTPQSQINAVRKKYEGTSQWMKAPNGEPTKLNEVQWLQVRTPNFKAWFGAWDTDPKNASQVVDSNGEPMVVYHATGADFDIFNPSKIGTSTDDGWFGKGFYFAPDSVVANQYAAGNSPNVMPVFLNVRTPFDWRAENGRSMAIANEEERYRETKRIRANNDGVFVFDDFIQLGKDEKLTDKQWLLVVKHFMDKGFASAPKRELIELGLKNNPKPKNDFSRYYGKDFTDSMPTVRALREVVAFDPTQVKSAIGNNGEFNQTNPDIRFSRKAKNPITEGIKSAANDAKNSLPKPISGKIDHFLAGRRLPSGDVANIVSKTELSLYHRTIGTQQNTALQNADFKKVYDMAQRYLQHVAVDAYAALKVAPNLLGKLESWSDLKKDVKKIWPANFIKQKADRAAVASIIFDETLNNELLSDADILKALTRDQRQIYKEARDAIQVSLENTAKSEMVRKLLAAEAINWSTVESMINQDLPVEQFAQTVRDMVESRIGGFKNELEAILDADPKIKDAFKTGNKNKLIPAQKKELKKALTLKAQIETTEEALKSLNDVENRLGTLIEQGYAPLMRFGEYTLTVRDLDGKVKSFFMFESKAEQVRATNAIVARYGKTVNLETDMISKEEFKQFAGMTPETMALFAKETGMDKDEAYQHYLKHAIPARSAMTRMIKRKGTEGFSDDIQRVVASFVMSNARMSAKNIYAAQIEKSIQAIESGKSVKDQAYVMKENVFNPKENFAQLRNFLFLWNLGGSIFFGLLNMTQPYMQTLPHLSQYVPIGDATRAILRGSKIAGSAMKNGTAPKGYEAEYNRAVREGVVDPQNVFMLSGVERGKTGASNSAWGVITHTMGLIAQVTESFNRKAVFIAALDVANKKGAVWLKKKGFNSAYDFAKDTVDQTQGVYDKANRSNWANTSVGAPLMVFKQFSINYVEQMVRMWKKEAASGDEGKKAVFLMLAMLASLSGMMGLPFIKDILDVSETTAAFLGNPVNIEREARLALGKDLADPLFNGVLNHFVFNQLGMDIQSRTGMPDLVPWSNALNPTLSAQGRINEFASIAGATGGLIEKGYDATQLIARDEYGAAAKTLAPRFLTSWIDGGKMALTNEVMDRKGNKLFDTTWDEGLVKFIDANPKRMADLSRTKSLEWKDFAIQDYMTTSFKQKIIAAMMDKDQAEVNKLMKEIDVWNNARSRYPVYIDLNTLAENANKKDQTFDAREKIRKGMTWVKDERPEM